MSTISTFSFAKSTQNSLRQPPVQELPSFKMQNLRQNCVKTRKLIQSLNPTRKPHKTQEIKATNLVSHGQVKNPPSFFLMQPKVILDNTPDIPSSFSPENLVASSLNMIPDSRFQSSLKRHIILKESNYSPISNFKI